MDHWKLIFHIIYIKPIQILFLKCLSKLIRKITLMVVLRKIKISKHDYLNLIEIKAIIQKFKIKNKLKKIRKSKIF